MQKFLPLPGGVPVGRGGLSCLRFPGGVPVGRGGTIKKAFQFPERLDFVSVGTTDEISKQLLDDIEILANLEPYLNI